MTLFSTLEGEEMKTPEWTIIKYDVTPNIFQCLRCGASKEISLPASIQDLRKQINEFCNLHQKCTEDGVKCKQ